MEESLLFLFFGLGALLLIALFLFLFMWKQYARVKQEKQLLQIRYKELEQKVSGADIEQLKYKLNPHLFRNALNAIQSHAYQSYYALDKLSNILDYILYDADGRRVSLAEEINFAKGLMEINRLKTSPLFDIRFKCKISEDDPRYNQPSIAPFSCINPIENAFKHADLQSEDAFINIVFSIEQDNWLQLYVANKMHRGKGEQKVKGGLGNPMFRERLTAVYGSDGFSIVESTANGIYVTQLRIKLSVS